MIARAVASLVVVAMIAGVVRADSAALDEAKQRTQAGLTAYGAGRYAEAERDFLDAYALVPEPALLYDLGRCRAAMGRDLDAAETFERYARFTTDPARRAEASSLAAEARSRARARAEDARRQEELHVTTSERHRYWAPASTALGGAALALVLTSIGTGAAAQSTHDDLVSRCMGGCPADLSSEASHGERLRVASIVTLALGGAAAVAGAIAFPLEWRKHRRASR